MRDWEAAVRERDEWMDEALKARQERDNLNRRLGEVSYELAEARAEAARLRGLADAAARRLAVPVADAAGLRAAQDATVAAARYREALERITAAHVAGASAGELADRARGVLRGGDGA